MAKKDKIYAELQIIFETTVINLKELSQTPLCTKNKISYDYLRKIAAKGKWTKGQKENITEISQKIAQKKEIIIQSELEKQAPKIKEIIEEELNRTARQLYLAQLLSNKLELSLLALTKKVVDKEGAVDFIDFDPKDLKSLASSLMDLQKVERIAEGLDKPETIQDEKGSGLTDLLDVIKKSGDLYK